MSKTIYVAAIAETCSGELCNCIVWADNEKALVEKVNDFFDEEENEGHPVKDSDFSSISEIHGLNTSDIYGDREYDIVTTEIPVVK